MPEMKRNVKDSVFTFLFRQPEYARELYLSLHPENQSVKEEDFQIVTLENILTTGLYNDLGVLVGGTLLVLVEAQSTFTVNVCLRLLMYLAQTYREFVLEHNFDLYSVKAIPLPCPELYVIYSGSEPEAPPALHLSSLFHGEGSVELTVRVLRGNGSRNIVDQYVRFCEIQTQQRKLFGYTQKAIEETMRICREEAILTPFLASREKEVKDIMFTLFDHEWIAQVHEENLVKDAKAEGKAEGRMEGRVEAMKILMDTHGYDPEQAMSLFKIPAAEQPLYRKMLAQSP